MGGPVVDFFTGSSRPKVDKVEPAPTRGDPEVEDARRRALRIEAAQNSGRRSNFLTPFGSAGVPQTNVPVRRSQLFGG